MGTQHQMRRGTSTQIASFTGADGEIVVDTTAHREVICDGVVKGGYPVARANITFVNNANYTVLATDVVVLYTAQSVAHSVLLPAASAYPIGQRLRIQDSAGNANTNNITVNTASAADHINASTTFVINLAFGGLTLFTQGSTQWVGWMSS